MPLGMSYAFCLARAVDRRIQLTWACAKEVNPPMLSGMSTSVANMGGFFCAAIMQPVVGWIMDLAWRGEMVSGARVYERRRLAPRRCWRATVCAALGAAASWRIIETRCRNIWQPA
jgi:hypothetical protein